MWVVKLGGSLACSEYLQDWLELLTHPHNPPIVIVPGGGPFANAVREVQRHTGISDSAAHAMALLAMRQYGLMLCDLAKRPIMGVTDLALFSEVWLDKVPRIWLPEPQQPELSELPASWDLTSDSLAAWLAAKLHAERLLLVKSADVTTLPVSPDIWVARGIVDPLFPTFLPTTLQIDLLDARSCLKAENLPGVCGNGTYPEIC